jgi:hypothetical protein
MDGIAVRDLGSPEGSLVEVLTTDRVYPLFIAVGY